MECKQYITEEQLKTLMEDLIGKMDAGDIAKVRESLEQTLKDTQKEERYIDRTYISKVKEKKRRTKITEIETMLDDMDHDQISNVYTYVTNEYNEPNHEAVALDAIIKLSKEQKK